MCSKEEFVFQSDVLQQSSFTFFVAMKDKGDYCDVILKAGNLCISAHSIIIAAAIPYLRETLRQAGTRKEVHIPKVDDLEPSAIQAMIEFAYHRRIKCKVDDVMGLLVAASRFQMDEVRDACCSFLANNLYSENVMTVRDSARQLGCPNLVESADKYIAQNFAEVSQTEDFFKCTFPHLKELIRRDDLQVNREEEVYESVMRWIAQSEPERKVHLPQLIAEVRLALLKPSYLRLIVARNELIRSIPLCRDLVDKVTDYHMFPQNRDPVPSFNAQPRCYKFTKSLSGEKDRQSGIHYSRQHHNDDSEENAGEIYCSAEEVQENRSAINYTAQLQSCMSANSGRNEQGVMDQQGSYEDNAGPDDDSEGIYAFHAQLSLTVQSFNRNTNTWLVKKRESVNINTASVSRLNEKICFMDCENVCYYNPEENEFNFTERYTQGRAFATVGDQLYIFGGSDGTDVFKTARSFDSRKEKWCNLKCMKHCREYAGCVAVERHLYVLGGNDLNDVHTTVERYDSEAKRWTFVEPMICGRSRLGSATLNGKIYVCGGIMSLEPEECTGTAEVYDPAYDTWTYISLPKYSRLNFTLVSYSGKLFALGGNDGNDENYGYLNNVEVYDPRTGKWKFGEPMAAELPITGAVVM